MEKPYTVVSEWTIKELLREGKPKYKPKGKMAKFEDLPLEEWSNLTEDAAAKMEPAIKGIEDRFRRLSRKPF